MIIGDCIKVIWICSDVVRDETTKYILIKSFFIVKTMNSFQKLLTLSRLTDIIYILKVGDFI